ncbi:urotensin-2 receptor-like [Antedon mediterranea]|uniref:urotensin-2 receptor-like n=1 Tax=Antedon mediterranea TaxID=105859 RepID=UPI003AF6B7E2
MALPQQIVGPTPGYLYGNNVSISPTPAESVAGNDTSSGNELVFSIISWTALCVVFVVGVTGNCFVLCMTCRPSSRLSISTINTYVMNLAVADLTYILAYLFFTIGNHLPAGWPFGAIGCKVVFSIDFVVMFVGAYILVAMSIERFVAIVYPMKSLQCRSVPCSRWVCGCLWAIGIIAIALPYCLNYETKFYEDEGKTMCDWTQSEEVYKKYFTAVFVIVLVIPSVMMSLVYASLLIHFWRTVGQVGASLNKNLRRSKRRVVTVVFLIVLAFWVCYIPFWTFAMVNLYTEDGIHNRPLGLFCIILSYINSCVNPLLYTLLTNKFNRWRESKKSSRSTSKIALRSV